MAALPINHPPEDLSIRLNREARLAHLKTALHRRMMAMGLTQADVSRAAKIGRDSMSRYTRGMTLPDPLTLHNLARVLDTTPADLDPGALDMPLVRPPANDAPGMTIRQSATSPDRVWVEVRQDLPLEAAAEIMMILKKYRETPSSE